MSIPIQFVAFPDVSWKSRGLLEISLCLVVERGDFEEGW